MTRLRNLLRSGARTAASAAIPLLLLNSSDGEAGTIAREIKRRRREHIRPRLNSARFPNGHPEPASTDTVRVIRFLGAHSDEIEQTMRLLADEQSKALLRSLFAYRALGPRHIDLPAWNDNPLEFLEDAKALAVSEPGGGFATQRFRVNGLDIEAWLINIWADFFERQYYFERGGVRIQPEPGDVVIDAGACFGDTALVFAESVGPKGRIHSFEPMPRQAQIFERNRARNPALAERIALYPFALSDVERTLCFNDSGAASCASGAGVNVNATTIDAFVAETGIRPTFIKMDIEGGETAALIGARETLKLKPKLAISAYHSLNDLVGLAPLIHSIERSYRFYFDHHSTHEEETVLYAC